MTHHTQTTTIQDTLGLHPRASKSRASSRRVASVAAVLVVVVIAFAAWRSRSAEPVVAYITEAATQGALTVTVSATGSLGSLTEVDVGTEISGVVERVHVAYNSPVRIGQVLAQVNTDKLEAQAAEALASLQATRAQLAQSNATVTEAASALARYEQVHELSGGRVPSKQELDAQVAVLARARAAEANSTAQIAQAEARLAAIETDMKKALIRSPINGIVLDRLIDPGQTVAASFTTPVLFTLAEDLTRMKLTVNVDEADIGNVAVGQSATFRVDAYGERRFMSTVTEVRSTPKTSAGVVTYETILTVDNSDRVLRPGMTATADIVVQQVAEALLVPNSALRFTPAVPAAETNGGFTFLPPPPGGVIEQRAAAAPKGNNQQVWVLVNGAPIRVDVVTGMTDGKSTQVVSGQLNAGAAVIVDTAASKNS